MSSSQADIESRVQTLKMVGLIVNPIAGMGGAVGLKGTDGRATLAKAIALGAKPVAGERAKEFLRAFGALARTIEFLTCPGEMGERVFAELGIACRVVGGRKGETGAQDTKLAAKAMEESGADIVAFCGGDGTARDVMDSIDQRLPALGVPAGVKMQSGAFAVSPGMAAEIVVKFIWGELPVREAEVADVDEEAFRDGRLSSKLYGYLTIPYEPMAIQGMKAPTPVTDEVDENKKALGKWIAENMEAGVIYVLGPGSTVKSINEALGIDFTLLGVDLVADGRLIRKDANESEVLELTSGKPFHIVVSPIGRQGFIFGRGNQQISAAVLRRSGREGVTVISTQDKLDGIEVLRVDTGDGYADTMFRGAIKVLVDYGVFRMVRVA
jgi:predicted polyphosphate/ATP-dependent NAD kinase